MLLARETLYLPKVGGCGGAEVGRWGKEGSGAPLSRTDGAVGNEADDELHHLNYQEHC